MAPNFGRRKILSCREQLAWMRGAYPHFRTRVARDGSLVAEGHIRPTTRSVSYLVRITYKAGEPPDVEVLEPQLLPREEGGRSLNVYPGNRLCLYLPGAGEWTPAKSLAVTLVPWIAEWLFYYETWRALGIWLGGGVEPQAQKTIRREHRERHYDSDRN